MEVLRSLLAPLLVLGALASQASAQNYLGMPSLPNGYSWAALTAAPGIAPPYGTFTNVPPGMYDNPSCCEQIWGGFCQKKAMRYQEALANGSPCCSGETPCPAPRRAACGTCRTSPSGCTRLPEQGYGAAPLPAAPEPTMAPAPEPALVPEPALAPTAELANPPASDVPAPLAPMPAGP